ncbi:hypothetical protein ZIOFF_042015 [Zingiber officinale]|uniref:dUTPase-like domain-containing protein n=1 Tax=Zingiber officinale TaxID=94328 RepID=A0A8J5G9X9_ZINOF|nr:hypothetical protein ZIOFF_042015 [Zingiber officinale]
MDGRISLSFDNYRMPTTPRAICYNEKDEEIQSDEKSFHTLAVLLEKAPWVFLYKDYPEEEDYLPWPAKSEEDSLPHIPNNFQQVFSEIITERQATWKKLKEKIQLETDLDDGSLLGSLGGAPPTIIVTRLSPNAILIKQKSSGVAGFDLAASDDVLIPPRERKFIPTGLRMEIPFRSYDRIATRSEIV